MTHIPTLVTLPPTCPITGQTLIKCECPGLPGHGDSVTHGTAGEAIVRDVTTGRVRNMPRRNVYEMELRFCS